MIHTNLSYEIYINCIKFSVKKNPKRLAVLKYVNVLDDVLVFIRGVADSTQSVDAVSYTHLV